MNDAELRSAIKAHLGRILGEPKETFELRGNPKPGAIIQHLEIPYFPPENHGYHAVFASIGGATYVMEDGGRLEGMLILRTVPSPASFRALQELLTSFATYAETFNTVLDMGDIIPADAQLRPLCKMSGVLLVPPVPVAAQLTHLPLADGSRVDFAWLLPVYEAEAQYALEHTSQSLMALFALEGVDPTEISRAPLDTSKRVPDLATVKLLLAKKTASFEAESRGDVIKITRRGSKKTPKS